MVDTKDAYVDQPVRSSAIDNEVEQLESWKAWAETKISDPTCSMPAIVQITTRGSSPPNRVQHLWTKRLVTK